MRLALADDDRAQWLCRILASTELPGIGQNRAICRLARLPRLEPGDPDSMFASWAVLAAAPPAERLLVHFQTPTAFSRRGESLLLPELERMLESWRRAWRRAPLLPEGIEHIPVETLRITRYVLRTETLSLKGGLRIGFIGEMELTLRTGTTPQVCCAVTALASVADFFGTGAKTALGMGQTRVRIADVRAVPTHESPAVRNAPSSL